jgi:hypothetical protein
MKAFGIRGYCLLFPLLLTIAGWDSCDYFTKSPPPASAPKVVTIVAECTPDQDPVVVHIGEQIVWQPSTYSAHFKGRTPLSLHGNPVTDVPHGQTTDVTGDSQCKNPHDTKCDFPYYLLKEDTNKKCPDPGVHVTP